MPTWQITTMAIHHTYLKDNRPGAEKSFRPSITEYTLSHSLWSDNYVLAIYTQYNKCSLLQFQ